LSVPTLSQLPQSVTVSADDLLIVGQDGDTSVTTVGILLASTQPRMTMAPGALLGRVSVGAGQPEPVGVGPGLQMQAGALAADTTVVATLDSPGLTGMPTAPTPPPGDESNAIATTAFVQRERAIPTTNVVAALLALPTTLPPSSGQLWWNGGVLSQS
jgi:hypothetical protein